jgi:hypothetical protein
MTPDEHAREKATARRVTVAGCRCGVPLVGGDPAGSNCELGGHGCDLDGKTVHQHRRCRMCNDRWVEVFVARDAAGDGAGALDVVLETPARVIGAPAGAVATAAGSPDAHGVGGRVGRGFHSSSIAGKWAGVKGRMRR